MDNIFLNFKLIIFFYIIYSVTGNDFKNLDDSVIFDVKWPGFQNDQDLLNSPDYEKITLLSADQEEYQCLIPLKYGEIEDTSSSYSGLGPLSLLLGAFKQTDCSLKIDSYWTYSVCHFNAIEQYHQELGKEVATLSSSLQKYQLGSVTNKRLEQLKEEAKIEDSQVIKKSDIPETNVQGINVPYYPVDFSDGTLCELTLQPRSTRVLYVCYATGLNEIYSVKEISTCKYEIIILNRNICEHPLYKVQEVPQSPIQCIPSVEGTKRPRALIIKESESFRKRFIPAPTLHINNKDGSQGLGKVEIKTLDIDEGKDLTVDEQLLFSDTPPTKSAEAIQKDTNEFLSGRGCIRGGAGFWRYEFCFGIHVQQFHQHADGRKSTILLGKFDVNKHIDFINNSPEHAPSMEKLGSVTGEKTKRIVHHYSGGSICDINGKPRNVTVFLHCVSPKVKVDKNEVTTSMLEPKPCEYVLHVTSGMICDFSEKVNEFGVLREGETLESKSAVPVEMKAEPKKENQKLNPVKKDEKPETTESKKMKPIKLQNVEKKNSELESSEETENKVKEEL